MLLDANPLLFAVDEDNRVVEAGPDTPTTANLCALVALTHASLQPQQQQARTKV